MRLWSVHPQYLDPAGLTACWREALLARKVLRGETMGYKNHPQLMRFKELSEPLMGIECYLKTIFEESVERGYRFDGSKIKPQMPEVKIPVTKGQLEYEFEHLKQKLRYRNEKAFKKLLGIEIINPNPLFRVIEGGIEEWEVIK